ncbi:uncharacterized protein [Watersipora subatra]|uniref:uncharacterized protein n=1 Tax=Watersipora subatra TaxID=2589382 RepID=UPI00355BACAD
MNSELHTTETQIEQPEISANITETENSVANEHQTTPAALDISENNADGNISSDQHADQPIVEDTVVRDKSSRIAKQSFIGKESQKAEVAYSLYQRINREIRGNDKLTKMTNDDSVTLDTLSHSLIVLDNTAEGITTDYAKLAQLSEGGVEGNIQAHFEQYIHDVGLTKQKLQYRIDEFTQAEIMRQQQEEELQRAEIARERQEEQRLQQMEEALAVKKQQIEEEIRAFTEYMQQRRTQHKAPRQSINAATENTITGRNNRNNPQLPILSLLNPNQPQAVNEPTPVRLIARQTPIPQPRSRRNTDNARIHVTQPMSNNPIIQRETPTMQDQPIAFGLPPSNNATNTINASLRNLQNKIIEPFPLMGAGTYDKTDHIDLELTTPVPSHASPSFVENDTSIKQLAHCLRQSIKQTKRTEIEPEIFKGDPIDFADWESDLDSYLETQGIEEPTEKLRYLKKYVGGKAKESINGYFLVRTNASYVDARQKLSERFGNRYEVARTMREKLFNWSKIPTENYQKLQEYADYLDHCKSGMRSMEGLSILNDPDINSHLASKLPDWAKRKWGDKVYQAKKEGYYPPFCEFVNYVSEEAERQALPIMQKSSYSTSFSSKTKEQERERAGKIRTLNTRDESKQEVSKSGVCLYCYEAHVTAHCHNLERLPYDKRKEFVHSNALCYACLKPGHSAKSCRDKESCKKCKKPHHPTCLHKRKEDWDNSQDSYVDPPTTDNKQTKQSSTCSPPSDRNQETTRSANKNTRTDKQTKVFNMGLPVYVSTISNPAKEVLVYAIMDSASDSSYITKSIADTLLPEHTIEKLDIETMMGVETVLIKQFTGLRLRGYYEGSTSLTSAFEWRDIPFSTGKVANSKNVLHHPHLHPLAKELPPPIDIPIGLLIGANCPQATLPLESIGGGDNMPYAQRSCLGWMVFGADTESKSQTSIKTYRTSAFCSFVDYNDHSNELAISQDDIQFMHTMQTETTRTSNGSYQMPLPFRARPSLPNNLPQAEKRLHVLSKKFTRDANLKAEYSSSMEELIQSNLAEAVPEPDLAKEGEIWYIPHFAVTHPQKGKLRVVFDCKARYQDTSLNDHLLQGPDMINNLAGILCRFRKESIAISCDIQKMFYNFFVCENDRDYLRFLWPEHNITKKFRMKVHLFGATSSPGVATYGLRRLASDYSKISSSAAEFIKKDFYVDDGLTSVETVEQAISLIHDARAICSKGNLRLHKFSSNSAEVLRQVPETERSVQNVDLLPDKLPEQRMLGLQWAMSGDTFKFINNIKEKPQTKRGILSVVSQLFDPLGFLCPFILLGKNILQKVTKLNVGWDDDINGELKELWLKWVAELAFLDQIQIPRCLKPANFGETVRTELHHFSDASDHGIGAASYIKLIDDQGNVHTTLLAGKSKVIPSKQQVTIPRLELLGAVAATKLAKMLRTELSMHIDGEYFWTDSKIVLGYISNHSKRFQVFVANRIHEILECTEVAQWRHVPGNLNPADIASRGLMCQKLLQTMWFTGPQFITTKELTATEAMHDFSTELDSKDPELKKVSILKTSTVSSSPFPGRYDKFDTWISLRRAIANLRSLAKAKGLQRKKPNLQDIEEASTQIIKQVQQAHFSDEMHAIRSGQAVSRKNALSKLQPFLDSKDILRVGGRAKHSVALSYDERHPIILPSKNHVSTLFARYHHNRTHHQGKTFTLAAIRGAGYWIVGVSRLVRSMINQCVTCRRLRGRPIEQLMADLPQERVDPAPPFSHIGMDCFGPFHIKDKRTELKKYGLILTCLYSRAIHIETLDDLSADALINALRCFICIRGPVKTIRCDNGTNFVGASNEFAKELEKLDSKSYLGRYFQQAQINFEFNVPNASHAGGIWERQIRNVRAVLNGMIAGKYNGRLNSAGLRTALYEAMAVVNSRPLAVDDLHNPQGIVLTPNHLVTMKGQSIPSPPGVFEGSEIYGRKMWRRVQQFGEEFWKLWKTQYLTNITRRQRWETKKENLSQGDIVLLVDDHLPRNEWCTAVVEEPLESQDGLVRKAKLRLANRWIDKKGVEIAPASVLERPVQKLVLLLRKEA